MKNFWNNYSIIAILTSFFSFFQKHLIISLLFIKCKQLKFIDFKYKFLDIKIFEIIKKLIKKKKKLKINKKKLVLKKKKKKNNYN